MTKLRERKDNRKAVLRSLYGAVELSTDRRCTPNWGCPTRTSPPPAPIWPTRV
jgi:hypothetical protein